jgi:outer membrane lipopolysaccharide assembly protein LptE/RlpB|tara:strand:- start:320 stop:859 length:540 start_codon:yes stop_codon:yes gene_type:complete
MINTTSTIGTLGRLGLLLCLSLAVASCGFYLQGQSQRSFPPQLNLYVDDPLLANVISQDLLQHEVSLVQLTSIGGTDTAVPTLQLTRTLKRSEELILDTNGEALIWRYTLTSQYLFLTGGSPENTSANPSTQSLLPISVSTDVDLSGSNATVNERIEADSWTLLYQQLGQRISRQLSFE